jgi:hypothetical protein
MAQNVRWQQAISNNGNGVRQKKTYSTTEKWAAFLALILLAAASIGLALVLGVLVHLIVDAFGAGWDAWR